MTKISEACENTTIAPSTMSGEAVSIQRVCRNLEVARRHKQEIAIDITQCERNHRAAQQAARCEIRMRTGWINATAEIELNRKQPKESDSRDNSQNCNAIACRWNAESPNCFLNPRIAATINTNEETAYSRSAICQSNRLPCHSTSPRQKLAIKSDQKTQRPWGAENGMLPPIAERFSCPTEQTNFRRRSGDIAKMKF